MGEDTGEAGRELAGIVWEEMGWMGVGVQGRAGRRPGGGAADTGGARGFRRSRNGLRPGGGGFWLLGEGSGEGGFGKGREPGMVQKRGVRRGQAAGPAAEPPTRAEPVCFDAVETACGRWGRKALPCMGKRISKTPKRPRSDVP